MSDFASPLTIVYRDPSTLIANKHNARLHPQRQIAQICASILRFGVVTAVLIDENDVIIAGHGRVLAALKLKLQSIPTIRISHLTENEKRALVLADNKIAQNGGWDLDILKQELIVLSDPEVELSETAGFETAETDIIIGGQVEEEKADPLDAVEEPIRSQPATTRPGDLWQLGGHRLVCGDAQDPATFRRLLETERAAQVVTDPPYNLSVDEISGLGSIKHPEFAQASGEMSSSEFQSFLETVFGHLRDFSIDGAMLMGFMDWRHIDQLLRAGDTLKLELKNICVWVKTNAGMGSLYRSQHEMVAIFKNGTAPHINNIELGKHGRYRTNVWRYAGANTFRRGRKQDLETHPTVKPIAMLVDAIKDCTKRNDIVLDAFGGSGSTLLAAERAGRVARLIEIDPYYCDATIARWRKMTGGEPTLLSNVTREAV